MTDKFDALKKQLEQEEWPNLYLFKFILPSDNQKIAQIGSFFSEHSEISIRPSNQGNYTSISVKEVMLSADAVIEIYEKAAQIEGVMVI